MSRLPSPPSSGPHDVTVRLRSFELDPDVPVGGSVPVSEHLSVRHGGDAGAGRLMNAKASEVAEADDLVFDWDRAVRANTFDAHRLCALAGEMGAPRCARRRSSASTPRTSARASPSTTVRSCSASPAECGLDERRVSAVLASDEYAEQVRADEQQARSMGVTSTPFVVANGYAAVTGAHPVEDYLALLRGVATQTV